MLIVIEGWAKDFAGSVMIYVLDVTSGPVIVAKVASAQGFLILIAATEEAELTLGLE